MNQDIRPESGQSLGSRLADTSFLNRILEDSQECLRGGLANLSVTVLKGVERFPQRVKLSEELACLVVDRESRMLQGTQKRLDRLGAKSL